MGRSHPSIGLQHIRYMRPAHNRRIDRFESDKANQITRSALHCPFSPGAFLFPAYLLNSAHHCMRAPRWPEKLTVTAGCRLRVIRLLKSAYSHTSAARLRVPKTLIAFTVSCARPKSCKSKRRWTRSNCCRSLMITPLLALSTVFLPSRKASRV
ncbi:MAG: hypothetical protein [Caudoviricetes sp.]|nr:MAG: hypothetical protein [Caudoviricetes sp.]